MGQLEQAGSMVKENKVLFLLAFAIIENSEPMTHHLCAMSLGASLWFLPALVDIRSIG
jgi:hypothetical protein